jgi:hypothetical protein
LAHFDDLATKSQSEPSHDDQHYVSRFDVVGLFQSALSKVFNDVPNLQGYGDWNPLWVITEIEVFVQKLKTFLTDVHEDETGKKQPVWAAIVSELLRLKKLDDRAPYSPGVPVTSPTGEGRMMRQGRSPLLFANRVLTTSSISEIFITAEPNLNATGS